MEIIKAWFPTEKEWNMYIKNIINSKAIISKEAKEIILKHYEETKSNIKIIPEHTIKGIKFCPNCNFKLIKKKGSLGSFFYACPKFPECMGYTISEWGYNDKFVVAYIQRSSHGWMQRMEKEFNGKGINFDEKKVSKFLKDNNLKTIHKIENELAEKENIKIDKIGNGWGIANENSKKQELDLFENLKNEYGKENVIYHQHILYKIKNNYKTFHRTPDFLIFKENKIIIIEVALLILYLGNSSNENEEQEQIYKDLLKFIFPKKIINFKYEFSKEIEKWF